MPAGWLVATEIADVRLRALLHMHAKDVSVRYRKSLFTGSVDGMGVRFGRFRMLWQRARTPIRGLRALCPFYGTRFLEEHLCCMVVEPFVLVTQKGGGHITAANV